MFIAQFTFISLYILFELIFMRNIFDSLISKYFKISCRNSAGYGGYKNQQCWTCGEEGHRSRDCPNDQASMPSGPSQSKGSGGPPKPPPPPPPPGTGPVSMS